MTKTRRKYKHHKSKPFRFLNCHPATNKTRKKSYTCYNDFQLKYLRALWNAKHPNNRIPMKSSNANYIWIQLKQKNAGKCGDEKCWLKEATRNDRNDRNDKYKNLNKVFAPDAPAEWKQSPNEWLSSDEIIDVMKQYEQAYKCFKFIGPSPIDFDARDPDAEKGGRSECVWEELCRFSVKDQIDHGKFKIGIIFNTDPHDKPGQHWISMFINIRKGQIFYFDSVGQKAPKEVMILVDRIIKQGLNQTPPIHFQFDQNWPVEHQYGDSECGVYSLYFIINMLEDKLTARYLKTHILTDKFIEKYRKIFFN